MVSRHCSYLEDNAASTKEYMPGIHAGNTRREYTPGIHAGNTRREYTPGIHAGNTRREYTPGIHAGNTRREYTPGIHAGNTRREYTPGIHAGNTCRDDCNNPILREALSPLHLQTSHTGKITVILAKSAVVHPRKESGRVHSYAVAVGRVGLSGSKQDSSCSSIPEGVEKVSNEHWSERCPYLQNLKTETRRSDCPQKLQ